MSIDTNVSKIIYHKVPDIWVEVSLSTWNPSKSSGIAFKIEKREIKWEFLSWASNSEMEGAPSLWKMLPGGRIGSRKAPMLSSFSPESLYSSETLHK